MTSTIQTQCPSCQSIYPIPEEQLNNDAAKARCPRCKTTFMVNYNRVAVTPAHTLQEDARQDDVFASITADLTGSKPNDVDKQENAIKQEKISEIPSQEAEKSLTVESSEDEYSILDELGLNDSIESHINNSTHDSTLVTASSHNTNAQEKIEDESLAAPELADVSIEADTKMVGKEIDSLGSVDDMSSWLDEQAEQISREKLQKEPIMSDEGNALSNGTGDTQPVLNDIDNVASNRLSQTIATDKHSNQTNQNEEKTEWLEEILDHDGVTYSKELKNQRVQGENELTSLLKDYGVDTENPESHAPQEDNKLNKMRDRVLTGKPTSQQVAMQTSPAKFIMWLLGCLLLLAMLVVQYIVFNINTLAKQPSYNEKLTSICKLLSCRIPSADLDSMRIINLQYGPSNVRVADKNTDIRAELSNLSDRAQLYPNLKVTIQGQQNLIGQFVAAPKDYLISERDQVSGQQSKRFMFTVPTNSAEVVSVQIEPFY